MTPTPTRSHRRYTKREKANAVMAAEATSMTAVSEVTGIPVTTIDYWMDLPEFVSLRNKTRDDLADGFRLLAHRAQAILVTKLPDMEPRDLTVLLGVATDKAQLLSGAATIRTERRDLTDSLNDHEKEVLADLIDRAIAEPAAPDAGGDPVGVGAAVRQ